MRSLIATATALLLAGFVPAQKLVDCEFGPGTQFNEWAQGIRLEQDDGAADGAALVVSPGAPRPFWLRSIPAEAHRNSVLELEIRLRSEGDGGARPVLLVEGQGRGLRETFLDAEAAGPKYRLFRSQFGVFAGAERIRIGLDLAAESSAFVDRVSLRPIGRVGEEFPELINRVPARFVSNPMVQHAQMDSDLLTGFWGRAKQIEAGVVLPLDYSPNERLPVCYSIHGFGGDHWRAWEKGPELQRAMRDEGYPRMLYVFLNASCAQGHHVFADSANTGPWGQALTEELIPALEGAFGGARLPGERFVTGHSSGGWSSLWLQVRYPDLFGGVWSTAPDPVDFRDFSSVDIYSSKNIYVDSKGEEVQLYRRNGEWLQSMRDFAERERRSMTIGGQLYSFDAVFSPRQDSGLVMKLFNRRSGLINAEVAEAWKRFDISLILRQRWAELGPKLEGKLRIFCGLEDNFRLEGACLKLRDDLARLGSDAQFVFVEDRDHFNLYNPLSSQWPQGLERRIHNEMRARYEENRELAALLSDIDAIGDIDGVQAVSEADHAHQCTDPTHNHGPVKKAPSPKKEDQ